MLEETFGSGPPSDFVRTVLFFERRQHYVVYSNRVEKPSKIFGNFTKILGKEPFIFLPDTRGGNESLQISPSLSFIFDVEHQVAVIERQIGKNFAIGDFLAAHQPFGVSLAILARDWWR